LIAAIARIHSTTSAIGWLGVKDFREMGSRRLLVMIQISP